MPYFIKCYSSCRVNKKHIYNNLMISQLKRWCRDYSCSHVHVLQRGQKYNCIFKKNAEQSFFVSEPERSPSVITAGCRPCNKHTAHKLMLTSTAVYSPSYKCLRSTHTHKFNEGCLTCSASTDARNGERRKKRCVCVSVWVRVFVPVPSVQCHGGV